MKNSAIPKNDTIRLVTDESTPKRKESKIQVALESLVARDEHGLTQPEAYQIYHESCLHSTISALRHNHGINIKSMPNSVKNEYGGKPFNRYWIAYGEDRERAQQVLINMTTKRGAQLVEL
jgi:hypothetical protein